MEIGVVAMQFNSIEFLFCFLPSFLAVYYLCPAAWRNGVLSLGSLAFFSLNCGDQYWWLAFLAGMILVTFAFGRWTANGCRKWLLAAGLLILTVPLAFFRLYKTGLIMPLGYSFYALQMAAYLVDVFRGKVNAEVSLVRYSAGILMFPKLLSGPLMNPADLQRQAWGRGYLPATFSHGLEEFIVGLALKVLLADRLGGIWAQAGVFGYDSISTPFAWMALVAYALRLYFDFWGYSMMARGLGGMLGFELPENFKTPYASKSVSEFYRRWHITLGAWFRDYIYIPMGGSRCSKWRNVVNLAVVWLLTGLWHGFGGSYLIWAGFLLVFIVIEKLFLGKYLERSRVISHIYLVTVILLSWLPFAVGAPGQMISYLGRLFGFSGVAMNPMDFVIWGRKYVWLLLAGAVMATPLPSVIGRNVKDKKGVGALLFGLFWTAVYFISTSSQDPFVYFKF